MTRTHYLHYAPVTGEASATPLNITDGIVTFLDAMHTDSDDTLQSCIAGAIEKGARSGEIHRGNDEIGHWQLQAAPRHDSGPLARLQTPERFPDGSPIPAGYVEPMECECDAGALIPRDKLAPVATVTPAGQPARKYPITIEEHTRTQPDTGRKIRVFVPHWYPQKVNGPICSGSLTFARWEAYEDEPETLERARNNAIETATRALETIASNIFQD